MIPKFYIDIDDFCGLDAVALVEEPAVETDFLAFSKDIEYLKFDSDKHLIKGVLLRADYPIYRHTEKEGDFYVVFTKDVITKIIQKFFKDDLIKSVNIDHKDDNFIKDVYLVESYQIDREKGINPTEFKDIENGSWVATYKVDNPEIWEEIKKGNKLKGFSVQGYFNKTQKENFNDFIKKFL